jgi:hypothetical protein
MIARTFSCNAIRSNKQLLPSVRGWCFFVSLLRLLWWIMPAICLFFIRDWNQVLLLVEFPAIREQQQAITSISLRMMLLCFFCGYFLCWCEQSVCSFSNTFFFFVALPTIQSVKLQEMNLLHIKLRVRYRRDMEIETELQIFLFCSDLHVFRQHRVHRIDFKVGERGFYLIFTLDLHNMWPIHWIHWIWLLHLIQDFHWALVEMLLP